MKKNHRCLSERGVSLLSLSLLISISLFLLGCTPPFVGKVVGDLTPPFLEKVESKTSPPQIQLSFNQSLDGSKSRLQLIEPSPGEYTLSVEEGVMVIETKDPMSPGIAYKISGIASDESGNELRFLLRYYAPNPNLAKVVLNEIRTEKSGKRGDLIELYVHESGSTAGYTLYLGSSENFSHYYILPEIEVTKGEYIVIHYVPKGHVDERDEVTDKSLSGGEEASDTAWDLWLERPVGISGKNGVISLYDRYRGDLVDLFVYSERLNQPDELKKGWTSTAFSAVQDVSSQGAWNQEGEVILPEEAFYSAKTTSTRTMNRSSTSTDTDTQEDWYVVATSQTTPGGANSEKRYVP